MDTTRPDEDEALEQEKRRGDEAARILNSQVFQDTIKTMEDNIFTAIRQCPIRDDDGLKNLRLMLKVLDDTQRQLRSTMETGKLAGIQIRQDEKVVLE